MTPKLYRGHPERSEGSALARVDRDGWMSGATRILSPNQDARPARAKITLIVVHGISLPPGKFGGDAVAQLFTNALDPNANPYFAGIAHLRVSSHFFIRRDGTPVQFVPCRRRAWHAGISSWRGRPSCNDFSVGIELEGTDHLAYTTVQYAMLAKVARALRERYPIRDIVGHSDIAPGRKTDPGAAFDWARLGRRLGVPRTDGRADPLPIRGQDKPEAMGRDGPLL